MYETIDGLIIQAIRENDPRGPLYASKVCREADRLSQRTGRDAFRIIDARIQALRKAKKIRYLKKAEAELTSGRLRQGWNVVA